MNKHILNIEVQDFINNNLNSNIHDILLKGTSFATVETKDIVEQIEAKKRSEKKLLTWFRTEKIYYPNKLNIEQTSSEVTALYKSELISGNSLIDLTGGFGVDSFYFSKQFNRVVHCEVNEELSKIASHNFKQLNTNNISTIAHNGLNYLKESKKQFDWIYIDPSRRNKSKGKVFFLTDCLPNIPENIDLLFKHSNNILIKTSPLLDITVGMNDLKYVKQIHVVAVNNEVKELLWVLEKGFEHAICVFTTNIKKNSEETFDFLWDNEKTTNATYSEPLTYLYEPNTALLKAGAFNIISKSLALNKLHPHSHLYTNDKLIDFPGRTFKIEHILPYNKKELQKLQIKKANITTRNFPENVEQLRKKFKISDGGYFYLFFTTNIHNEKIVLVTLKAE